MMVGVDEKKTDIEFTSDKQDALKQNKKKRKKTGGRQKGTCNRVNASVKENIINVFNRIGGAPQMAKWARKNPKDFYGMYSKLIPRQVEADIKKTVRVASIKRTIIDRENVINVDEVVDAVVNAEEDKSLKVRSEI